MGPPRDGVTRFSWHVEIDGPRLTWRTAALLRHAATDPGRNKKTYSAVDAHSAVVLASCVVLVDRPNYAALAGRWLLSRSAAGTTRVPARAVCGDAPRVWHRTSTLDARSDADGWRDRLDRRRAATGCLG